MAEKTIRQKIELTGEKQYNQAIKEATRQLKLLESQMKAETAEMGRNASEQDKARVKAQALQKQIQEQEQIVETLREALARAREEYGDNEEVVGRWELRLNNARTTLGNMRSDLDGLDGSLSGAGDAMEGLGDQAEHGVLATRSLAEALGDIGEVGSGIAGTLEGIFGGLVDTVRSAASEVWGEIVSLAGKVNGWSDLAGYWNTSTTEIQKWANAVEASHNDFNALQQAVTRINMGDQKKIAEYAGVSREGYEDEWKYAMAVMDALNKMDFSRQQEALGKIFGEKKATGVKNLLNDWATITGLIERFDAENGGVGMTEEQMSELSTLAERVDTISTTWQAFKESFIGEHLAKLSLQLTGNVQGALDALIAFMDADSPEAKDAALADFTRNVEEFFTRLGEAIQAAAEGMGAAGEQMQGSGDSIVRALGDVLVALSDAMKWFAEEGNINLVIRGFEALVGFWAGAKVVGIMGSVAKFAADLTIIKGFSAGGAAAAGAGAAAGGGGWLSGALGSALKVLGPVGAFGATLFGDFFRPRDSLSGSMDEAGAEGGKADTWYMHADVRGSGEAIYKDHRAAMGHLPTYEDEDLTPEYTRAQMEDAIQDWWDAWRAWDKNPDEESEAEADRQDAWAREVMGDAWSEIWTSIVQELDNVKNQDKLEDIPAGWYRDILDSLGGGKEESGLSRDDISGFRSLPEQMQSAVQNGASAGVAGIQVLLDGYSVGQLVAPYVSAQIARDIGP